MTQIRNRLRRLEHGRVGSALTVLGDDWPEPCAGLEISDADLSAVLREIDGTTRGPPGRHARQSAEQTR